MPTGGEKKALWFLAIVALSGSGVRLLRSTEQIDVPADSAALDAQIARVDSVRALNHAARNVRDRRLRAGAAPRTPDDVASVASPESSAATIDLDRATERDIETLPGIGPALAQRIVTHRDSVGAFGQIEALCDVSGIGPALVKRLRPLVTFTGPRRPLSDECGGASTRPRKALRRRD